MSKRLSIISLIISCFVCAFLVVEYVRPTSSLVVLISTIVLSIIGFICSIISARNERTRLSITALVLGIITTAIILALFLLMLIMGA